MDSDQLLVWLEIVPEGVTPMRQGMLCRRHADAMVVPRGWTLDDRRESKPRLFRVPDTPAPTDNHPSRGRRQRTPPHAPAEPAAQLALGGPDESAATVPPGPSDVPVMPVVEGLTVGDIGPSGEQDLDETKAIPWRPVFDDVDDLGGLLKATSPLLSRAFRGLESPPPRPT
jgi:hypothetical protein